MDGFTKRRRALPGAVFIISALAVAATAPASALAGTASVQGDTLVYDAAVGEDNLVELVERHDNGQTVFRIRDSVPIVRGGDCVAKSSTEAECTVAADAAKVQLNLANLDDFVRADFLTRPAGFAQLGSRMTVDAGPGADIVNGGTAGDTLTGGDGDDTLHGNGGGDVLSGNIGQDELDGGAGHDSANGGIGPDVLDGSVGEDQLLGADGDDVLRGGIDDDELHGNGGNDTITGGAGLDLITGGTEADSVNASDGQADSIDCGGNLFAKDSADVDGLDSAIGCEKVF